MQYGKDYDVDRQPEVSLKNEGNVNVLARSRTNTNGNADRPPSR